MKLLPWVLPSKVRIRPGTRAGRKLIRSPFAVGGVLVGDVKDIILLDVTPLSLGIETLGGVFTRLIKRNTTIPCEKSQVFSTAADNQTQVGIKVLQGEREMAADNKLLGEFELVGIPPAPRGVPQIEVSFSIDVNGIVQVKASDKATNKEQRITIQSDGGLSPEDIQKMVADAEAHATADQQRKELIEVKNEADSLIYSSQQSLTEHGSKIDPVLKDRIEKDIEALRASLDRQESVTIIKGHIKELQASTMKIGEQVYKSGKGAAEQPGQAPGADNAGPVDAEYEEKPKDK